MLRIKTPEDITAEAEALETEKLHARARAYLNETDWLVVRHAETGAPPPEDVTRAREKARDVLSR